jgi:hypothetical protein
VVKQGKTPVSGRRQNATGFNFTRIRCPAYGTWLALIAAMFYSFARVSAVLKLKVDDYYDNGCAGEWDHLKREMPWKSPSSRRHLTS